MSGTDKPRVRRNLDGLLLLDKPSGLTSNAVLQRVKWLYRARKAGHTGSLDPLASGMLPICFGEATKFAGYLLDANKTYRVQARFGIRTDTADAEGQPVAYSQLPLPSRAAIEQALAGLRGPIFQVPPMYSALKVQGQRLYSLARAGREVPREARPVQIHEFELEDYDPERPIFRVECSKGTYIRSLIEDLATALGTLAHVVVLRRLAVGPFEAEAMLPLAVLEAKAAAPAPEGGEAVLDRFLRPLEAVLPLWPDVCLDAASALRIRQGATVQVPVRPGSIGQVRIHGPEGVFLGIGELGPDGRLVPRRLVATPAGCD